MKNILLALLIIIPLGVHAQSQMPFLVGKWKIENKETYESWKLIDGKLEGRSFEIIDGKEKVSETLMVYVLDGKTYYQATVLNQNNAKPIDFELTTSKIPGAFIFVNAKHDFPKKIIYQVLTQKEIFVQVLGENDRGFSLRMLKVED